MSVLRWKERYSALRNNQDNVGKSLQLATCKSYGGKCVRADSYAQSKCHEEVSRPALIIMSHKVLTGQVTNAFDESVDTQLQDILAYEKCTNQQDTNTCASVPGCTRLKSGSMWHATCVRCSCRIRICCQHCVSKAMIIYFANAELQLDRKASVVISWARHHVRVTIIAGSQQRKASRNWFVSSAHCCSSLKIHDSTSFCDVLVALLICVC